VNKKWIQTQQLQDHFSVSQDFLQDQIRSGAFTLGIHYLIPACRKRVTYLWDPEAIQELWSTDPAFRSVPRTRSKARSDSRSDRAAV